MRNQSEIEATAEENRSRLLEAEIAALLLLRRAVKRAPRLDQNRLLSAVMVATLLGRQNSREIAANQVARELGRSQLAPNSVLRDAVSDRVRAERAARGVVERAKQLGTQHPKRDVPGLLDPRLRTVAATESANSYNNARSDVYEEQAHAAQLLKVWDAQLDKRTCWVCSRLEGRIVGITERWSDGEPGNVHPNCRCTFTVLNFDETGLIAKAEPANGRRR